MIEFAMHVLFTIVLTLSMSGCERKNQVFYGDNTEIVVSTQTPNVPPSQPPHKPKKEKKPKNHD